MRGSGDEVTGSLAQRLPLLPALARAGSGDSLGSASDARRHHPPRAVEDAVTQEILLRSEVAAMLRCSPPTVSKLVASGKLKAICIGPRTKRFRLADVERFILEQANGSRRA